MSLRQIPVEKVSQDPTIGPRAFNPGSRLKKNKAKRADASGLKLLCHKLVRYINKGSRYTYDQVDELIMGLHRSILDLTKKKQDLARKKKK